MSVKRYELKTKYRGNESWDELEESPDGMYVRYEDYAESHRALRAETTAHENTQMQLEKVAAENAGLKKANGIALKILNDEETMVTSLWASSVQKVEVETPATNSFLAEVRASGVDALVERRLTTARLAKENGHEITARDLEGEAIRARFFAMEIRKGVQS